MVTAFKNEYCNPSQGADQSKRVMETGSHGWGMMWRHTCGSKCCQGPTTLVWCQILENLAFQDFEGSALWDISPASEDWVLEAGHSCQANAAVSVLEWAVLSPGKFWPQGLKAERVTPPSNKHKLYDFCVYVAQLDLKLYSFKPRNGCSDRIIHQFFTILGYWYLPK